MSRSVLPAATHCSTSRSRGVSGAPADNSGGAAVIDGARRASQSVWANKRASGARTWSSSAASRSLKSRPRRLSTQLTSQPRLWCTGMAST